MKLDEVPLEKALSYIYVAILIGVVLTFILSFLFFNVVVPVVGIVALFKLW